MRSDSTSKRINVAIAGLGNCAASFLEGLCFYRQHPDIDTGLLFPALCGYSVRDIEIVTAFDISLTKVAGIITGAVLVGSGLAGTVIGGWLADYVQLHRPDGRLLVFALGFLIEPLWF